MKVAYIQTSPIFGEKEQNFNQIDDLSTDLKADLIVLPELFATGYTFKSRDEANKLAESSNGKTYQFLKSLSFKTSAIIVGGFIELLKGKIYNSSLLVFKDLIKATYQKIHLFNQEKLWFSPGKEKYRVYDINNTKIGIMICFDWIFPEATRSLALQGAEIIAHPSNLVLPYCQNAMKIRCLENRVFAVTTNRIGKESRGDNRFLFTGGSQITSYNGEVLAKAPKDEIHVEVVSIDVSNAQNKKLNDYNDLFKDRNPQLYTYE
ncbi:MAG: hypothetical protein GF317_08505 [Candidatus Lokiarchaeota archaeon]|nr:hypothetical protein [Candidatus Lokiarchaeota archaeon]MBD3199755.1 hypothetical protein [Candidatus Lokiarchaeota archaeon]